MLNMEIHRVKEPLNQLAKTPMPASVGLEVIKMGNQFDVYYRPLETMRSKLVTEYCTISETDPGRYDQPTGEKGAEFFKKLGELMEAEQEVNITPVELPSNVEVAPYILMALDGFVTVAK